MTYNLPVAESNAIDETAANPVVKPDKSVTPADDEVPIVLPALLSPAFDTNVE
jgi:hypothetical protein